VKARIGSWPAEGCALARSKSDKPRKAIGDIHAGHPATVSRAVANKFAETPRGIIALRSLFSSAVSSASGQVSSQVVEAKIRKIIETEDPARPVTDDYIAKKLASEGLQVARRTVSAYREELHLPNARRRSRLSRSISQSTE
jgi:RNA polymerase sigma-54 factor